MSIQDISINSYNEKKLPVFYVQSEFQHGMNQYFKNDVFDTYDFGYEIIVEFLKSNLINTQEVYSIENAPCI